MEGRTERKINESSPLLRVRLAAGLHLALLAACIIKLAKYAKLKQPEYILAFPRCQCEKVGTNVRAFSCRRA